MGDGNRVEASPKREKASSGLKCPALHQSLSDHHHFFFENTGRLLDIPGEHVAVSGLPKPPAGGAIRRIDVIIRVDRDPPPAAD